MYQKLYEIPYKLKHISSYIHFRGTIALFLLTCLGRVEPTGITTMQFIQVNGNLQTYLWGPSILQGFKVFSVLGLVSSWSYEKMWYSLVFLSNFSFSLLWFQDLCIIWHFLLWFMASGEQYAVCGVNCSGWNPEALKCSSTLCANELWFLTCQQGLRIRASCLWFPTAAQVSTLSYKHPPFPPPQTGSDKREKLTWAKTWLKQHLNAVRL